MPGVSAEELAKLREENEKLRDQIVEAQSTQAEREAEQAREVQYAQLSAEKVRLEADLSRAKEAAKAGAVKEGASGPLAAAKEQLAAATAAGKATVGPVDTNASKQPKDTGQGEAGNAPDSSAQDKNGGNS